MRKLRSLNSNVSNVTSDWVVGIFRTFCIVYSITQSTVVLSMSECHNHRVLHDSVNCRIVNVVVSQPLCTPWLSQVSEWVLSKFNGTSTPKGSYRAKTDDNDCKVNSSRYSLSTALCESIRYQAKCEQNVRQDLIPRVRHGEAALCTPPWLSQLSYCQCRSVTTIVYSMAQSTVVFSIS